MTDDKMVQLAVNTIRTLSLDGVTLVATPPETQ
jgi:hypothetical protein